MTSDRLLLALALAFCTGCATTKQRPIKPAASPSVSTINQWGEVWRTYVSPDGYLVEQYVGMLDDSITVTTPPGVSL